MENSEMEKELKEVRRQYGKKYKFSEWVNVIISILTVIMSYVVGVYLSVNEYGTMTVEGVKGYVIGFLVIIGVQVVIKIGYFLRDEYLFRMVDPMFDLSEEAIYFRNIVDIVVTTVATTVIYKNIPYINVEDMWSVVRLFIIMVASFIVVNMLMGKCRKYIYRKEWEKLERIKRNYGVYY